jgi:hypothetical protein
MKKNYHLKYKNNKKIITSILIIITLILTSIATVALNIPLESNNNFSIKNIILNEEIKLDKISNIIPQKYSGVIWTTRDDCGDIKQNVNQYCIDDEVYINGEKFEANTYLEWNISVISSKNFPKGFILESGEVLTDEIGSFCIKVYTVKQSDSGEYGANVGGKKDNFNVNGEGCPNDSDGDGVPDSEDCDPFDATVWQNLTGYVDVDGDDYGVGESLIICSGEDLPDGYAPVGGDCDDSNASINPGAEEICDDGVDNDCDGSIDEGCGGGGSNGGGGGGGTIEDTNEPPIAIGKANPEIGTLEEIIYFDGSESTDDGEIVNYTWDFKDGTKGYGVETTHNFTNTKLYQVKLTVTDDGGLTNSTIVNVTIITGNNPPNGLKIEGPDFGHQHTAYMFNATAYDPDINDTLHYTFNWGDGKSDTSEYEKSEIIVEISHDWSTYGIYSINVYAEDESNARSETKTHIIYIDVHPIDDEIQGYLIDENSDGIFDRFYNYATGNETNIQKQDDGTYLIDSDGDGNWDYIYDIETDTLTKYEQNYTSLCILGLLALLLLLLLLILTKRDKDKKKKEEENKKKQEALAANKKQKSKNTKKKSTTKKKTTAKKKTSKK